MSTEDSMPTTPTPTKISMSDDDMRMCDYSTCESALSFRYSLEESYKKLEKLLKNIKSASVNIPYPSFLEEYKKNEEECECSEYSWSANYDKNMPDNLPNDNLFIPNDLKVNYLYYPFTINTKIINNKHVYVAHTMMYIYSFYTVNEDDEDDINMPYKFIEYRTDGKLVAVSLDYNDQTYWFDADQNI